MQRSTPSATYYPHPTQQRYDGRTGSRPLLPDNSSSSISQYHSQAHPQHHARSTSQADQRPASHDQCTPLGSHPYSNLAAQSYNCSYTTAGILSRASGPYSEGCTKEVASELTRHSSLSSSSSLKYECDYCGKGFTRPSSLKVCISLHRPSVSYLEYDC